MEIKALQQEDDNSTGQWETINTRICKKTIDEKRSSRKHWQITGYPEDKRKLNRATKELKSLLENKKQNQVQDHLTKVSTNKITDYSLWRTTKKLEMHRNLYPP